MFRIAAESKFRIDTLLNQGGYALYITGCQEAGLVTHPQHPECPFQFLFIVCLMSHLGQVAAQADPVSQCVVPSLQEGHHRLNGLQITLLLLQDPARCLREPSRSFRDRFKKLLQPCAREECQDHLQTQVGLRSLYPLPVQIALQIGCRGVGGVQLGEGRNEQQCFHNVRLICSM